MPTRRVSPQEAKDLIDGDGYVYLDVRSIPEFERGHAPGAYNVPLLHFNPAMGGMTPNPQFVAVVEANFAKDAKMVVACAAGRRSAVAIQHLEAAGFTALVDSRAGFDGAKDGMGRTVEPGWAPAGLPVVTKPEPERTWAALVAKLG